MFLRSIFTIFLTLIAVSVWAESCKYASVKFDLQGDKLPFSTQSYLALIRQTDDLLCLMDKPQNLNIKMQSKGLDAHYVFADNEIHAVGSYEKYPSGKTAHPIYGQYILIHEYTHAVFTPNMMRVSPMWGKWIHAETTTTQLYSQLNDIQEKMFKTSDPTKLAELEEAGKKLTEQINTLQAQLNSYDYILAKAINEFFADVVPVVLSKNPRAMYQALKKADEDKITDGIVTRDFSQNYGEQMLSRWNLGIRKLIQANNKAPLRYDSLGPFRSFTWELIKGPAQNPKNQTAILAAIFSTLAVDYERRFRQPIDIEKFDFILWNKDLTKALAEKLRN